MKMSFNKIIKSWKRIPYFLNFYVEEKDKDVSDKSLEETLESINTYIEDTEFHEKIHCFISQLFKIPSMIVYNAKYNSKTESVFCWALCRPLIQGSLLKFILMDTIHFCWDLLTDCIDSFSYRKFKSIHIRSPVELIKSFLRGMLEYLKYGNQLKTQIYHSFDEIKNTSDRMFLDEIERYKKGIYSY